MDELQEVLDRVFEDVTTIGGMHRKFHYLSYLIRVELEVGTSLYAICYKESQKLYLKMMNQ